MIEALFSLLLIGLVTCLNIEVVRRAVIEVSLHHGSFLYARDRALGIGQERARRRVAEFLANGWGQSARRRSIAHVQMRAERSARGVDGRLHYRYPALLRFPYRGGDKHHFEVTKRCRFPF